MTINIPGEEPVGYTWRAENWAADRIIEGLEQAPIELPTFYGGEPVGVLMKHIAELNGIDYDNPYSYDSDDFPKPIYADQLSCSDQEWTELAPSHTFEFLPREDGVAHCMHCGIEELPRERSNP